MSKDPQPEQPTVDRSQWVPPKDYGYAISTPPNAFKQESWVRELTEQVEYLTRQIRIAAMDRAELAKEVEGLRRPPPKTVTTPKAKEKGGAD